MNILEFHLRAFGPFTDHCLDLSAGGPGLHVLFGPNEAGKSSALRAMRGWLYGIPERSQDDFLHDRQSLRVGGRLRGSAGDELVCFRRKGRKQTLLGADDQPIQDDRLTAMLDGVDERLFERLFGIDHESLVSGGQALLAERGREAEALFGAALGSIDLNLVLKRLDQEATDLFLSRGSKPAINARLVELAQLTRRQRESLLSVRQWEDARKSLQQAEQRLTVATEDLAGAARERSRLERIRRTLPNLARRAQFQEQLAQLGEQPILPEDFGRTADSAADQRRVALARLDGARQRHRDLHVKAAALQVSESLLAQADLIDDLREGLGSYRKAAFDRPKLTANRDQLLAQAGVSLGGVGVGQSPAELAGLRPLLARRRRVTDLGAGREARFTAVAETRAQLTEVGRRLAGKRQSLADAPPGPSLDGLRRALEEARRAGGLDDAVGELAQRAERRASDRTRELAALGLWRSGLAALRSAALPGEETIERFVADFQALADERQTMRRSQAELLAERQRGQESLRALALAGAVPAETDLDRARSHRDEGWALIRRDWLESEDIAAERVAYADDQPLPAVFEAAVAEADEIADRLRREAQRVHEQAAARARLESCDQRLGEFEQTLAAVTHREAGLVQSWQSIWSAWQIEPLPPREMRQWRTKAALLIQRADEGDTVLAARAEREAERALRAVDLRVALIQVGCPPITDSSDPALGPILAQAEAELTRLAEQAQRRARLTQEIQDLEETERRLDADLLARQDQRERWLTDWAGLMAELGLPAAATPAEADDHLATLDAGLRQIEEAQCLDARIAGIDAEARAFEGRAAELIGRIAPELAERAVEESVVQLHARLGAQRADKSRRDELLAQAELAEQEIRAAETAIRDADLTLAELCRQAGRRDPVELAEAESGARQARVLRAQIAEVDAELLSAGDGLGIDALIEEAGSVDRDRVRSSLAQLETRIDTELTPEHARLLEQKLEAARTFADMTGTDEAAALADEVEQVRAGLRRQAERYIRVRLAARVLRDEIERFRRQHRDPILLRASHYFARLTCDAFAGIETDFDESDQPVLVGRRANGKRLRVEGMSTGTRDQLYLALRLASLDHHLDGAEPMPFMVDDILIQFDDARAKATLAALADFSARTQVVLFTHHRRVLEQARELDPAGERIITHALAPGSST